MRLGTAILTASLACRALPCMAQTDLSAAAGQPEPERVIIPDTLHLPADGADDAPSLQRAVTRACATGAVLHLLGHAYRLASPILQTCAVTWQGQGWQEPNGGAGAAQPGRGSWLVVQAPGFTPITVSGPAAAGSVFEDFGIYQRHPAPGPGWRPTAYPYVFRVDRTNGQVAFRHLMALAIDKGIDAFHAARLRVTGLHGQFFTNAVHVDKTYDTTTLDDIRNWPFWTTQPDVLAYQQAEYDHIILGRVDDAFLDRIFSLAGRSTIKLVTTPADPENPASLPGGSPTNLAITAVRSDFVRWSIWNTAVASQFDDVAIAVGNLTHQGAAWGGLTPLPGSAAVRNDGAYSLLSIGYLKADVLDAVLIDDAASRKRSVTEIGRSMVIFSHSTRGRCALQAPGHPGTLHFASPPLIDSGANVLTDRAEP